ncbi:PaaI family thioesterase [Pseudovibrio exalbescens]|uniref:PaaI family thioesterase n=1 Tax=Pseudovibrio exalbescens TaxID=197461 RepID=UPI000C9CCB32|nr:PaaI family thioesterase [Pseudovibrio exalbescens]
MTFLPYEMEPNSNHQHCVVCSPTAPGSLALVFTAHPDGSVTTDFLPDEAVQGYTGQVHGGIIASLLDAAMTHVLFQRGVEAVTAELKVRYVKPVQLENSIRVAAWEPETSRRIFELYGEIRQAGKVVAWAEGKFMKRPAARP